ncbi:MAG: PspC domain-containing protein [Desulfobacteraceae bacterium]|nr:PspC domain-containing protein [Desulfobacteraceae bacterium]
MRKFKNIFHGGLYRSRNGVILGVCRGIAEYFDFSVFWGRIIALALLFISGFWPTMALYFIAGLLMKPEPVLPISGEDEQEFYDGYIHSRKGAVDQLNRRYGALERRIQHMEHSVTRREFDWENRLNS